MKELLGNNGNKIYDLETEMKSKGAYGLLILPDPMKNCLKVRIPQQYRNIGEELLRNILCYKSKEAIRKNIVHIPFSKGMVLVVTPGAIISEIIYNDETLMYQISDLRNYQNYNEALMDIQNTFEFHQFNMIRKQEETIGILYFKSQTQAQEAQENLRQRPLIGKNGPILELKAIEKSMNQPCLKIIAAIHHQQLVKMLEYYGEPQYLNIKTLENSSLAYIRYRDSKSTELCFHEFNN